MKRITHYLVIALLFLCSIPLGFKTTPSYAPYLAPTNTVSASPVPVYAPQIEAVEVEEEVPAMNIDARDLLSLIAALSGIAAVVISLFAFFRANPQATPAQVDERAAASLDDLQKNRAAMEAYELALEKQSEQFKMAFDTLTTFARMLAGMIPSKAMQEAADVLADIKTPGAPAPTTDDRASG